jgi:hypothetical protein
MTNRLWQSLIAIVFAVDKMQTPTSKPTPQASIRRALPEKRVTPANSLINSIDSDGVVGAGAARVTAPRASAAHVVGKGSAIYYERCALSAYFDGQCIGMTMSRGSDPLWTCA